MDYAQLRRWTETRVSRYKRLMNIHYTHKWLFEISRYMYFYIGLGELIFLSALSIVGERENIRK
ncbi:hypothetical protein TELCIR_13859 [Teladorsagia circumcincta]|uniref:Uncharacterized protein n=1 Tax=Teladorsagia circumcincta TaxID=45464 RepID=A0A2G9U4R9_TELCI|nr:hypothetical protein TELCIR_13859 [Teladorsagia circumcincta]